MQKRTPLKYAAPLLVIVAQLYIEPARGQGFGDDPIVAMPEILIIVDSSGSMRFGAYGGTGTKPGCWDDDLECVGKGKRCSSWGTSTCSYCCRTWSSTSTTWRSRAETIREVLTGTYETGKIGTCTTNQKKDGILDSYKELIRFGFAQFDNDDSGTTWDYGSTCSHQGIRNRTAASGALIDLVSPGAPDDVLGHNVLVQTAACSTQAVNGTPIGAAISDANWYFTHWYNEVSPVYSDPLKSCRFRYVLFLSDGEESPGSPCMTGAARAQELFANQGITTFVVGFGDQTLAAGLNAIARAGSGNTLDAFIAEQPEELRTKLTLILNSILTSSNSRTAPTSAPSISTTTDPSEPGKSYRYRSYFDVTGFYKSWEGHIIREEVTLDSSGNPIYSNPIDFADVLAAQSYSSRKIYTVTNDPRSLNYIPNATSTDYKLPRAFGSDHVYRIESAPTSELDPLMCLEDVTEATTIKNYTRGNRGTGDQTPLLGDSFHSSPVVVPPPSPIVPDYRFGQFYLQNKDRYSMLYIGGNDGMLHAFVAEDKTNAVPVGTELWGFIPTNLLPKLQGLSSGHSFFVDLTPVVQDVFFRNLTLTDASGNVVNDSEGNPIKGAYRTILVSGERGGGSAYFALDVTDPKNPKYLWEYRTDVLLDGSGAADYTSNSNQCSEHRLETWAEPVIGDVWLRNSTDNPMYVSKTVVVVPGGYFSPYLYANMNSCIDLMETVISAASVHIIDIETGQLLKKFIFTDYATATNLSNELQDFHTRLAAGDTATYDHYTSGVFQTADYNWTSPGWGWRCAEKRNNLQNRPFVPTELLDYCTTTNGSGVISYQKACCCVYNSTAGDCSNECTGGVDASDACSYRYTKYTDGRVEVWLKTEGCGLVPDTSQQGRLYMKIGAKYGVETVASRLAGYDTTLGQYLTRVFAPSNRGKLWRIDLANGKYSPERAEGDRVVSYSDGGKTYDWKTNLWFDTSSYTTSANRPIMVPSSLALDYQRDLVLFFGTSSVDSLEYSATQDYFFAVKETTELTDGIYTPTTTGVLFCESSPCANNPITFSTGERMYGKPLIINGKTYFTTYTPSNNSCNVGAGRLWGLAFDDLSEGILDASHTKSISLGTGTPSAPTVIWAPGKAQVQIQLKDQVVPLSSNVLRGTAQIIFWNKIF